MAMLRCMNCMEEYNEKFNKCPHCGCVKMLPINEVRHLMQETILQRRYVVGNVLRQDDQEIIYIGWDLVLEKKIAIREFFSVQYVKRITGQKAMFWENEVEKAQFVRGMERFIAEAQQLARFREETGMIRIYDTFEENGTAYIIMEYSENLRIRNNEKAVDIRKQSKYQRRMWYVGFCIGMFAIIGIGITLFIEIRNQRSEFTGDDGFAYEMLPDMTGYSYQQAEKELEKMGVKLEREKFCFTDSLQEDIIVNQNLASGTRIKSDMIVKVVVTQKGNSSEVAGKDLEETKEDSMVTEERTTQERTSEQKRTEQKTIPKTTEKKTTGKKTEQKNTTEEKKTKKTTEQKNEQEKITEQPTTEEIIVIEE